MKKNYFISKNEWLLARISNFFSDEVFIGDKEELNGQSYKGTVVLIAFISMFLSGILSLGLFLLYLNFEGKEIVTNLLQDTGLNNDIISIITTAITGFTPLILLLILFHINIRILYRLFVVPKRKKAEQIANLSEVKEHNEYITLTENNLIINQYNRYDTYVDIPIKNINNIYLLPGDLGLFSRNNWRLPNKEDDSLAHFFSGKESKQSDKHSKHNQVVINGETVVIQTPHSLNTIEQTREFYKKHLSLDIKGKVEKQGYFLMIFMNENGKRKYYLLYVTHNVIGQGLIKDLNIVLNYQLKKSINTPCTYKELNPDSTDLHFAKPKDYDETKGLVELREELERFKNSIY